MNADSLAPLLAEDAADELAQRRAAVEAIKPSKLKREEQAKVKKELAEKEAPFSF